MISDAGKTYTFKLDAAPDSPGVTALVAIAARLLDEPRPATKVIP